MAKARKLRLHATGQWTCKIGGRSYYFGTDEAEAYRRLEAEYSSIVTGGRRPMGTTVRDAANAFLASKEAKVDTGELGRQTFAQYHLALKIVEKQIGARSLADLQPSDFIGVRAALAKGRSPLTLSVDITRVRGLFKFAYDEGLLDRPVRYGASFDKPAKSVLRRLKKKLLFSAGEIRQLLDAALPDLKAMIYLGINGGLGNADCCRLTTDKIIGTWLDYPRVKTGVDRRIPLWPETLEAIQAVGQPKGLLFVRDRGHYTHTAIGNRMRNCMERLGLMQEGRGFYTFRRCFQTIGDESKDFVAVQFMMGHAATDMSNIYRQRISDDRLLAVVEHVRAWLKNSP